MGDRKKYLVTFQDQNVDVGSAAAIVHGDSESSAGSFSIDPEGPELVSLLAGGTSVAMLTPEQANRLRHDPRVAEVVEDFEVRAQ